MGRVPLPPRAEEVGAACLFCVFFVWSGFFNLLVIIVAYYIATTMTTSYFDHGSVLRDGCVLLYSPPPLPVLPCVM